MMVPVSSCECIGSRTLAVGDAVELVALDGTVEARGCVLGIMKSDYIALDVRDRGHGTAHVTLFLEEDGTGKVRVANAHPTWLQLSPRSNAIYNDGKIVAWEVGDNKRYSK